MLHVHLTQSSDQPIYLQIVLQIRRAILNGELEPGYALPSIRQLAKDLQISVITTKRAYEELEKEGLIDSIVGKGSFVSGANPEFLREQQLRLFEGKLAEAVTESKSLQISLAKLIEHITILYESGED